MEPLRADADVTRNEEFKVSNSTRPTWLSLHVGHLELLEPDIWRKLVAELWGTFVLVFVGIGTVHNYPSIQAGIVDLSDSYVAVFFVGTIVVLDVPNWEHGGSLQIALTFGFGVAVGVYTVGHISGGCAHYIVERAIRMANAVLVL